VKVIYLYILFITRAPIVNWYRLNYELYIDQINSFNSTKNFRLKNIGKSQLYMRLHCEITQLIW